MASTAAITIRREIVDVEVRGTEADGLALQARLPELCTAVLAPALESALRDADPGDDRLCIERLEIDLDVVPADALERSLAEALRHQVAEWLRHHLAPSPNGVDATADGDVTVRSAATTVDEALVEFLRTGRLPWAFRVPPGARLETIVLDAWNSRPATGAPRAAAALARLRAVLGEPNARARLLLQFTPGFVAVLVRRVAPQSAATIDALLDIVGRGDVPGPLRVQFTDRLWELVLVDAAVGRTRKTADLVRVAWLAVPPLGDRAAALAAVLEQHWPRATAPARSDDDAPAPRVDTARQVDVSPPPAAADLDDGEGLLVENAGLVLLHPFLPRLLTGVGLAVDDELTDPGRAVGLLDHLVTGELTAPEHRLPLAKVLCGIPLDQPVPTDVGLTEIEVEEAAAVLDAAIAHWPVLRNTSPEGLRNEFLQRPGTLARDSDGAWLLRVETRTVDILLDQLPWSLSMFRLPWMSRMMRVEWR